jgi:thiol:disulfide interchange protein DsbG
MICGVLAVCGAVVPAWAQDSTPAMPKPLQTLADQGAQVRYMGKDHGMDAWLSIQRGQEQYFYVTAKGDAMIMGLMFETETGRLVTIDQIQKIQKESGGVLDLFSATRPEEPQTATAAVQNSMELKTPAEKLMEDVESSNFLTLGNEGAPVVYAFIDPQCPYCHSFIQDLRTNYLNNGLVQLRMIPVGFREVTKAQAAFMLGAPDATARFMRHIDGDKSALPVSYDINQQGVERNMAIMQAWKLNVTPLIIYRAGNGEVKIIQGRAKSIPGLISDLPKKS